jgi:REP element-mobilizing transposase RayT
MLTWTTYGSWLQGDERGYVKDGMIHEPNKQLNQANRTLMKCDEAGLTLEQRQIVINTLRKEAGLLGQEIYAIAVGKNHIHLVVSFNDLDAGVAVSHYKNAARLAIQDDGFIGKLWTRGFSKRYCFDEQQLQAVIAYVNAHNKSESPQVYPGGLKPPT